ncbi:hypothetical protein TCAL_15243, partial [Tigriopus californicus]
MEQDLECFLLSENEHQAYDECCPWGMSTFSVSNALKTLLRSITVRLRSARRELQIALISVIDDILKLFTSPCGLRKMIKLVKTDDHHFNPRQVGVVTLFIFILDLLSDLGHVLAGDRTIKRFFKNRIDTGIALFIGSLLIPWAFFFLTSKEGKISYLYVILVTLLGTMTMGLVSDQITLLLFLMPRNEKLERAFHKLRIDPRLSKPEINDQFKAKLKQ